MTKIAMVQITLAHTHNARRVCVVRPSVRRVREFQRNGFLLPMASRARRHPLSINFIKRFMDDDDDDDADDNDDDVGAFCK